MSLLGTASESARTCVPSALYPPPPHRLKYVEEGALVSPRLQEPDLFLQIPAKSRMLLWLLMAISQVQAGATLLEPERKLSEWGLWSLCSALEIDDKIFRAQKHKYPIFQATSHLGMFGSHSGTCTSFRVPLLGAPNPREELGLIMVHMQPSFLGIPEDQW